MIAGAFQAIVALGRSPTGIGSHDPSRLRERMTTRTFPPSCAPENPLHLCEDARIHFDRGIHRETGRIYHPSCLSCPMVKTGDMTRSELNPR